MFVSHTALYFVARLVPGAVNFAALIVFSRLLSPDQYGNYALVLAAVGFGNAILFSWLQLSLLRHFDVFKERETELLSSIIYSFIGLVGFTGVAGILCWVVWGGSPSVLLYLFGILVLWGQAWFELNAQLKSVQLNPRAYGVLRALKAVLALVIGSVLAGLGEKHLNSTKMLK